MQQYTQDYNFLGLVAQQFGNQFGEIRDIQTFWRSYISPITIDTEQNELFFIVDAGFTLLNNESQGSFNIYCADGTISTVYSDFVAREVATNIYQWTTNVKNRFAKSARNFINIQCGYVLGYLITYKDDVFDIIP